MRDYRRRKPEITRGVSARYYERNREIVKQRNQEYRDANRDRVLAWNRAYFPRRDREKARAQAAAYYAANREQIALRHREWRQRNRQLLALYTTRRRLVVAGQPRYEIPPRDLRRLVARYRNACAYCAASGVRLEWEHVVPISKGGLHRIGNLVPACRSCNASKRTRFLSEWRYSARRSEVSVA